MVLHRPVELARQTGQVLAHERRARTNREQDSVLPGLRPVDWTCNVHRASKSVVAQKKLFLNAAYLLRETAISSENCGSLRRLLSSGSVVK